MGLPAKESTAAPTTQDSLPAIATATKVYTATATLLVAQVQPHVFSSAAEKFDRDEFEIHCNTQAALVHDHFVLIAALRDRKMNRLQSIRREDARHQTISWLTSIVHVNLEKNSGIITVSVTLPDAEEAATIVNAVVQAYMDEVVNVDRSRRREQYESLNTVAGQKEEEVRRLREELKHEMENLGTGDEQTASVRRQMAVQVYAEYQREWQAMRQERARLQARLQEATESLKELNDAEISDLEVSGLLFSIPVYRELFTRSTMHELEGSCGEPVRPMQSQRPKREAEARLRLAETILLPRRSRRPRAARTRAGAKCRHPQTANTGQ